MYAQSFSSLSLSPSFCIIYNLLVSDSSGFYTLTNTLRNVKESAT